MALGYDYNEHIELPSSIKILSFNCKCVKLIENLPNTIEELNFGDEFNLPLNNLPSSIKSIKFNKYGRYNI